jgi:hypothetical protein
LTPIVNGVEMGTGTAKTKRLARTLAAREVLAAVEKCPKSDTAMA